MTTTETQKTQAETDAPKAAEAARGGSTDAVDKTKANTRTTITKAQAECNVTARKRLGRAANANKHTIIVCHKEKAEAICVAQATRGESTDKMDTNKGNTRTRTSTTQGATARRA